MADGFLAVAKRVFGRVGKAREQKKLTFLKARNDPGLLPNVDPSPDPAPGGIEPRASLSKVPFGITSVPRPRA